MFVHTIYMNANATNDVIVHVYHIFFVGNEILCDWHACKEESTNTNNHNSTRIASYHQVMWPAVTFMMYVEVTVPTFKGVT